MPRSIHVAALSLLAAACTQTPPPSSSSPAPVVSLPAPEPSAPATAVASTAPTVSVPAPVPTVAASASQGAPGPVEPGVAAKFRACKVEADCVVVPREGCCHNGWNEAVNASQKDAYKQAYACTRTPRPMCPMFIVRDTRVARCDAQTHLCTMVQP